MLLYTYINKVKRYNMKLLKKLDLRYPRPDSKTKRRFARFLCESCNTEYERVYDKKAEERPCNACAKKESAERRKRNGETLKPLKQNEFEMVLIRDLGIKNLPSGAPKRFAEFECAGCSTPIEVQVAVAKSRKLAHCKECGYKKAASNNTKERVDHEILTNTTLGTITRRCYNEKNKAYVNYGGRGIKVHDKWLVDKLSFNAYVTKLENFDKVLTDNWTLDRIDVNGNYEPGNVRWASRETQAANCRVRKDNTSGYTGVQASGSRWRAIVNYYNRSYRLGTYDTKEEAVTARNEWICNNKSDHPIQKTDNI